MRRFAAVIVPFLCAPGAAGAQMPAAAAVVSNPTPAPPLACSLPQGQRAGRSADLETLLQQSTAVRELPDGFAFAFPSDPVLAGQVLDFVLQERLCCPFFSFEIAFEPGDAPFRLEVRGPEGVKEFVGAGLPEDLVPSPKE